MIPASFDYDVAESVEHALELLHNGDAKLLAGGHSLIPALKLRIARPERLVDIGRLDDLAYVRDAGAEIAIGALTCHRAVASAPLLQEHCPIVSHTAARIGDPQVRHRGTIGGSLAHGDPASDLPAVMLAVGAELVVRGATGDRTVSASQFFTGVFETAVGPAEMLTEIRVPKLENSAGWAYLKAQRGLRTGRPWASPLSFDARTDRSRALRSASSNGCDTMHAQAAEAALASGSSIGDAAQLLAEGTEPPSDQAGSSAYRAHLVTVVGRRALEEAIAR